MSRPGTEKLDSLQSQRIAAGHTITSLAKKANVSDRTIITLESGGNCEVHVAIRIADALAVTLTTLGHRVM